MKAQAEVWTDSPTAMPGDLPWQRTSTTQSNQVHVPSVGWGSNMVFHGAQLANKTIKSVHMGSALWTPPIRFPNHSHLGVCFSALAVVVALAMVVAS